MLNNDIANTIGKQSITWRTIKNIIVRFSQNRFTFLEVAKPPTEKRLFNYIFRSLSFLSSPINGVAIVEAK